MTSTSFTSCSTPLALSGFLKLRMLFCAVLFPNVQELPELLHAAPGVVERHHTQPQFCSRRPLQILDQ
jgi:hypothetical protein